MTCWRVLKDDHNLICGSPVNLYLIQGYVSGGNDEGEGFFPSLDHSKNVSKYKIDYFSHSHVFHLPRGMKKIRAMQINRLKTRSEIH